MLFPGYNRPSYLFVLGIFFTSTLPAGRGIEGESIMIYLVSEHNLKDGALVRSLDGKNTTYISVPREAPVREAPVIRSVAGGNQLIANGTFQVLTSRA
jgi:hypothetical protein